MAKDKLLGAFPVYSSNGFVGWTYRPIAEDSDFEEVFKEFLSIMSETHIIRIDNNDGTYTHTWTVKDG